jgi:2'-hydroxyisoflavone reductase
VRVRKGGEILAPGDGSTPIQIIDGRDLTAFEVLCMEKRIGGTFNCTGPDPKTPLTMKRYLEACRQATGSDAEFVWADPAFLEEQEIGGWMDMPCWLPEEGEYAGFGSRNIDQAIAAGLSFRPLKDTILDTLSWLDGLPDERRESVTSRSGLDADREAKALEAWHAARG